MKKSITAALAVLTILCAASFFSAQQAKADEPLKWFDKLEDDLAEAKKTGKPIFLEIR